MKETKNKPEEKIIDQSAAERILNSMPDDEYLYDLSECFRIFGDSTRIKILFALFEEELCVGDIAAILNLSQSSVSHQLRILKDAKLVKFRRDGNGSSQESARRRSGVFRTLYERGYRGAESAYT